MRTFTPVLLALLVLPALALANPGQANPRPTWTSTNKVARAARDLGNVADAFRSALSGSNGYTHIAKDASDVAYGAQQLERQVNNGARFPAALQGFRTLSRDYRTMAQKFRQTSGGRAPWPLLNQFWGVQDAAFDLSFQMFGGQPRLGPGA